MTGKKIRTLLVEDEMPARAALRAELEQHCPEVDVVAQAGSIKTALEMIAQKKPELILLDVRLTDGLGIEILKQIDPTEFHVIFTTAYSEWAIEAVKFSAIDYLLKPIDGLELKASIEKVMQSPKTELLLKLRTFIENQQSPEQKIAFQTSKGIHVFQLKEIIRFEADVNYTMIYATDRSLLIAKTLKEIDAMLSSKGFMRVHQSHLVNEDFIITFKNQVLKLKDGTIIPVSQRKRSYVAEKLNENK